MGRHKSYRPDPNLQPEPQAAPAPEVQGVPAQQTETQPQQEKPPMAEEPKPMTEEEKRAAAMRHFNVRQEDLIPSLPEPKAGGVKFLDDGRVKLFSRRGTFIWTTRLKAR